MNWSINHRNWKYPGMLCTILFFFLIILLEWAALHLCGRMNHLGRVLKWLAGQPCMCTLILGSACSVLRNAKTWRKTGFFVIKYVVCLCGCYCSGWQILLLSLVVFHSHSSLLVGLNWWEWRGSVGWKDLHLQDVGSVLWIAVWTPTQGPISAGALGALAAENRDNQRPLGEKLP